MLALLFTAGCNRGPKFDETTKLMMAAHEAEVAGDKQLAVDKVSEAIALKSDDFAMLFRRAKLYAELGKDEEAKADLDECEKLDPEHQDLKWIRSELKKPVEQRFGAAPPSHGK